MFCLSQNKNLGLGILIVGFLFVIGEATHAWIPQETIDKRGTRHSASQGSCASNAKGPRACESCCQQKKKNVRPNLNLQSCLSRCSNTHGEPPKPPQ